jgi:hypothetical protein
MTSRQLTTLGRRIMKRLAMHEWIPGAEFKVVRELKAGDDILDGDATWHAEERLCRVRITRADTHRMVETLVHEILHVNFEGHLPEPKPYDPAYEFGLNRASAAFMAAWWKPKQKCRPRKKA